MNGSAVELAALVERAQDLLLAEDLDDIAGAKAPCQLPRRRCRHGIDSVLSETVRSGGSARPQAPRACRSWRSRDRRSVIARSFP